GCSFGTEGVEALARSTLLSRLTSLALCGNSAAVRHLAAAPAASRLEVLRLTGSELDTRACLALADSPHLGRLACLGLRACGVGDGSIRALVMGTRWGSLRRLDLADNPDITDAGARMLAGSPLLARLTHLDLEGCHVGK